MLLMTFYRLQTFYDDHDLAILHNFTLRVETKRSK